MQMMQYCNAPATYLNVTLRAYAAIQLASALESNDRLLADALPPLTFVSADQRLLTAASAEGLATEDPNLHN